MKKCPHFETCNAPICPLDANKGERVYLIDEAKCRLSKSYRLKYGEDLHSKGLFPREFAGLKSWESKSDNNKSQVVNNLVSRGTKNRFAPRKKTQNK